MTDEEQSTSDLQTRIAKIEARLNAVDADTLKAIGSNSVIEAVVKRAGDDLLGSPIFRNIRLVLIGLAGFGLVVWAGGTVFSQYQINSVQQRAAEAELKMDAAETKVLVRSKEVLKESVAFEQKIDKRANEITNNMEGRMEDAAVAVEAQIEPTKQRIETAAITVEQARSPAEDRISQAATAAEDAVGLANARIETAAREVETKSAEAIDEIATQQQTALTNLQVPSIEQLGKVKAQIEGLENAGARLNLKSIQSFVDLQVAVVLLFSVVAFAISIAAWIRAGRNGAS